MESAYTFLIVGHLMTKLPGAAYYGLASFRERFNSPARSCILADLILVLLTSAILH
jgi:hypothetical protein